LRNRVKDEIEATTRTRAQFQKYVDSKEDVKTRESADVFFDDLRVNYIELLNDLNENNSKPTKLSLVVPVVFDNKEKAGESRIIAMGVLSPFVLNAQAYDLVASDPASLFINIEVKSFPQGATVKYHRRGEDYKLFSDPTNSILKGLARARWYVLFHLDGYVDQEKLYDPYVDKSEMIVVGFEKIK
jgi:hypothetical protein